MARQRPLSPASLAAQAARFIDQATGAIVPPVHPATTFARDEAYEPIGDYVYAREQSPTYAPVERVLAELERGAEARLFASGLGAMAAVFETIETGQHVVAPSVMYHGGQDWLRRIAERRGIGLTLF